MNASVFSEPFTPRGVAVFARVPFNRLLLAQLIFALVAGIVVAWVFYNSYFPVVQNAIENLPADGEIRAGHLNWTGDSPQKLAENNFLSLDVDLDHSGQLGSTADLQIEFGRKSIRIFSLFGYTDLFYPRNQTMLFNRPELDPLWKAWRAIILFFIVATTLIALVLTWWLLATIYFLPVWLLGFFTNRELDLRASWKLSGAALLPGALLMTAGILLYGLGFIGLVPLGFIFGAHFVLQWLYLFFGSMFLSRTSTAAPGGNPFKPS
jgi:hypothetical protein